jgi:predicted lipoprotein with Yx(FWY)xxD motif
MRAAPVAFAALALVLAGCGQHSSTSRDQLLEIPVPTSVTVQTGQVAGLGTVLTDGSGHTLYMFPPDAGSRVSCTGACAGTWPPLVIEAHHAATAGSGIDAGELSTILDPNTGAQVITYAGFPLYRYDGDTGAAMANGQGLFLDGGPWYALTAAGQPITKAAA